MLQWAQEVRRMDRHNSQRWNEYRNLHAQWLEEDDEEEQLDYGEPDYHDWEYEARELGEI